jgi:hypothetical protein
LPDLLELGAAGGSPRSLGLQRQQLSISPGVDKATGRIIGTHTVTLRSAIEAANSTPGSNTIRLSVAGTYKITIPPAASDDTAETEINQTGDFDIIPNASSPRGSTVTIVNDSGGLVAVSGNPSWSASRSWR